MKKNKVIIDTDPGVDDTTALILSLFNKKIDIKLITTVAGNLPVNIVTRNMCHLLDLFGKKVPVVKGASHPMHRKSINAAFLHGEEGLGGYQPPKTTKTKPIEGDVVEKIHDVIMQNPNEVTIFVFGPHTNMGKLFTKYPECAMFIKRIIFMGGSPYDSPGFPLHDSFNIMSDPEAFDIVLKSGAPLAMIPSNIGRYKCFLTEDEVEDLEESNDTGKFLSKTYEIYWEPALLKENVRVISTNDTCALFYLIYPRLFISKKADIKVDTKQNIGRTYARFSRAGQVDVAIDANRDRFIKKFFKEIRRLNAVKLIDMKW